MTIDLNNLENMDAIAIATAVKTGQVTAKAVINKTLEKIKSENSTLNCFTSVTGDSAIAQAESIDSTIANGQDPGELAGVPFAVKNLFDIAGLTTLAGSKINQENPPATEDATAIVRLKNAGAVLVGALNMDEYAYGFVTENSYYGATKNPRDLTRIAGGSSGGSASSVAAGLVPISLGSDTNGSIRVPASLCGIFGFKPTYGRLSRSGVALFSSSLDHVGPFARSVRDIAAVFDVVQGSDVRDPVCSDREPEKSLPQLNLGIEGLRIAVANNYFSQGGQPEVFQAVQEVKKALNVQQEVTIPEAHRARAAAFVITACEGANLHLDKLRSRPQDFDFATRDRFLAGALIPANWYVQCQRFRQWFRDRLREIFQTVDIIIAPTTPIVAPKLGQETMMLDGQEILIRPNLGLYTQPLSFIGLPVLSIPIYPAKNQPQNHLPFGVQIIAAPYNESLILRVAAHLEAQGIISAPVANYG